ncbi:hypothetical protein [Jeotgalibacillus malaysiensis]|uniref:hypothetical protein n=1 Tax=Jeotgalibacillus malaysiensis TaxID=1508404 RepID=UPI003850AB84
MKTEVKVKRIKSESFLKNIFRSYIDHSTPSELKFDLVIPAILSFTLCLILYYFIEIPREFLIIISGINGLSVTIISILAGFNTASLAIIASTNKDFLNNEISKADDDLDLKDDIPKQTNSFFKSLLVTLFNNKSDNKLKTLIIFFSYAIVAQLIIIVIGLSFDIIFSAALSSTFEILNLEAVIETTIALIFIFMWLTVTFHVIFLSIRNVDMIFKFILYTKK